MQAALCHLASGKDLRENLRTLVDKHVDTRTRS